MKASEAQPGAQRGLRACGASPVSSTLYRLGTRVKTYRTFLIIVFCLLGPSSVQALETERSRAVAVEVLDQSATLLSHESVLLGLSCKSGQIGELPNLRQVKIGDIISYKDYSFRVGLIEVTKFSEDMKSGGQTIAKKGDIVCVLAADERSLPYEDRCKALWVRIAKCRPLR
jgi:hypothetical protein